MLFAAENSALSTGIGVAGGIIAVIFSLAVAVMEIWLFSEADYDAEGKIFVAGCAVWMAGLTFILFVTTTIQGFVGK